jgi:hypothetical protein
VLIGKLPAWSLYRQRGILGSRATALLISGAPREGSSGRPGTHEFPNPALIPILTGLVAGAVGPPTYLGTYRMYRTDMTPGQNFAQKLILYLTPFENLEAFE